MNSYSEVTGYIDGDAITGLQLIADSIFEHRDKLKERNELDDLLLKKAQDMELLEKRVSWALQHLNMELPITIRTKHELLVVNESLQFTITKIDYEIDLENDR